MTTARLQLPRARVYPDPVCSRPHPEEFAALGKTVTGDPSVTEETSWETGRWINLERESASNKALCFIEQLFLSSVPTGGCSEDDLDGCDDDGEMLNCSDNQTDKVNIFHPIAPIHSALLSHNLNPSLDFQMIKANS